MIERILMRRLSKKLSDEQTNNYQKQKTSSFWKLVNWIICLWFFVGLLLSYLAYDYGIDSSECEFCNQLAKQVPSIDLAAAKSDYPNVMRVIWLYLTITTPFASFALFFSLFLEDYVTAPASTLKQLGLGIILNSVWVILSYYELIEAGPHTGTTTRMGMLWIQTVWGGYFISFTLFFSPLFFLWITFYHSINLYTNR